MQRTSRNQLVRTASAVLPPRPPDDPFEDPDPGPPPDIITEYYATPKRTLVYNGALSSKVKEVLQNDFPDYEIVCLPRKNHSHPMSAFYRNAFEQIIIDYIDETPGVAVCDIGGNAKRHHLHNRLNIWSCCPILSSTDVVRNARYTGTPNWCTCKVTECQHGAPDVYIAVDSIYYLSPDEVLWCIDNCTDGKLFACYHVFPEASGQKCLGEYTYKRLVDGSVVASVRGNNVPYNHDCADWISQTSYYTNGTTAMTWTSYRVSRQDYVITIFMTAAVMNDKAPLPVSLTRVLNSNTLYGRIDARPIGQQIYDAEDHQTQFAEMQTYSVGKWLLYKSPTVELVAVSKELVAMVAMRIVSRTRSPTTFADTLLYAKEAFKKSRFNPAEQHAMLVPTAVLAYVSGLEQAADLVNSMYLNHSDKILLWNDTLAAHPDARFRWTMTVARCYNAIARVCHLPAISGTPTHIDSTVKRGAVALLTGAAVCGLYAWWRTPAMVLSTQDKYIATVVMPIVEECVKAFFKPARVLIPLYETLRNIYFKQPFVAPLALHAATALVHNLADGTGYRFLSLAACTLVHSQYNATCLSGGISSVARIATGALAVFCNVQGSTPATIFPLHPTPLPIRKACLEDFKMPPLYKAAKLMPGQPVPCNPGNGLYAYGVVMRQSELHPTMAAGCYHNELRSIATRQALNRRDCSVPTVYRAFCVIWKYHLYGKTRHVKPYTYQAWSSRFTLAQRAKLDTVHDTCVDVPYDSTHSRYSLFVKQEKTLNAADGDFDPRNISGPSPRHKLEVGPWMSAFEHHFADYTQRVRQMGDFPFNPFIVTKGLNPTSLGALYHDVIRYFGETVVTVENDGSRWDGTMNVDLLSTEELVYSHFGCPADVAKIIHKTLYRYRGSSKNGVEFSTVGTRKSGDPQTSIGNSLINGTTFTFITWLVYQVCQVPYKCTQKQCKHAKFPLKFLGRNLPKNSPIRIDKTEFERIHGAFCANSKHVAGAPLSATLDTPCRMCLPPVTCFVDGDDMLAFFFGADLDIIYSQFEMTIFESLYCAVGIEPKVHANDHPCYSTYLSGYFYPCKSKGVDTFVHGPMPIRPIIKMGWCEHKYRQQIVRNWLFTVGYSNSRDYAHIPIVRALSLAILRLGTGGRYMAVKEIQYRKHVEKPAEVTQATYEFFTRVTGLTREQIDNIEALYSSIDEPCSIEDEALEEYLRRSLPKTFPTEDALVSSDGLILYP